MVTYTDLQEHGVQRIRSWRVKQKKPYKAPLPYERWIERTVSGHTFGNANIVSYTPFFDPCNSRGPGQCFAYIYLPAWSEPTDALQSATEEYYSAMGSASEQLVNTLELGQTKDSVVKNAKTILSLLRSLRKLDFRSAADTLGFSKAQRNRYRQQYPNAWSKSKAASKTAADRFLEWHFGWSPLIKDIHESMKTLTSDPPHRLKVKGKGFQNINWKYYDNSFNRGYHGDHYGSSRALVQSHVSVSNPNVYLANQLGLSNPATVIWEVIPFSWVVDYFFNVSDVLKQFSSRYGLRIEDEFYTQLNKDMCTGGWSDPPDISNGFVRSGFEVVSSAVSIRRVIGAPPWVHPRLRQNWMNPFKGSPYRAASVVAVLAQTLANIRSK